MAGKCVVIGGLIVDVLFDLDTWPKPNTTVWASQVRFVAGGKGLNMAVGCHRLGMDVTLVGQVGDDFAGKIILDTLAHEQLSTTYVEVNEISPTGVVGVLLKNTIPAFIGSTESGSRAISLAHVHKAVTDLQPNDYLVINQEVEHRIIEHALKTAKSRGVITVFNPAPLGTQIQPVVWCHVDYLIPNLYEAQVITGINSDNPALLAQSLLDLGIAHAIITLGEKGIYYADRQLRLSIPAYDVQVVDTTGASDAFIAGFVSAHAKKQPIDKVLRYAAVVAALACTQQSGAQAMPTLAQLDEHVALLRPTE